MLTELSPWPRKGFHTTLPTHRSLLLLHSVPWIIDRDVHLTQYSGGWSKTIPSSKPYLGCTLTSLSRRKKRTLSLQRVLTCCELSPFSQCSWWNIDAWPSVCWRLLSLTALLGFVFGFLRQSFLGDSGKPWLWLRRPHLHSCVLGYRRAPCVQLRTFESLWLCNEEPVL